MPEPKPKKIVVLELTDITHHARSFRPAQTLASAVKTAEDGQPRGRLYMNEPPRLSEDGKSFSVPITLPADLQRQVDAGEIEVRLAIPKAGIPALLGRDAADKIAQIQAKARRETIHRSRRGTWRAE
jgi:hypothetical protein